MKAESDNDEVDLEIERNLTTPSPLDRSISSISLEAQSNRYSDGYDLRLSAEFGVDRIRVDDGVSKVEFVCSIKKAEI